MGKDGQRKKEPRQYITPSAVRRGRPAKIAITPAESNEIKLHYLACHGAINHTPFSRPSPRRALSSLPPPSLLPLRRVHQSVVLSEYLSIRVVYTACMYVLMYVCICVFVQIPMLGSEESADEDEEDSIWSDLRDRSLADARKRRGLSSTCGPFLQKTRSYGRS